ncbi:MAG: cation-translocating P-type ATPase [Verrucomicrobiae bacterium]|nr:cation-translocating P-type ATPase [Verrucomicrobiae bacterium]
MKEPDATRLGDDDRLRVEGMTCQNCARRVWEAAQGVAGVAMASVDLDAGRLRVRWEKGAARDAEAVARAVSGVGFPARREEAEEASRAAGTPGRGWLTVVWLGAPVTVFLMVSEWVMGWGHTGWYPWVALGLALPVQVWGGARFYRGAWEQLKRGGANMDTLVSLGSTAAFGFSLWIVLSGSGGHVYFMESAAILTLISVGHWLEALAAARAGTALRALLGLAPPTARRLEEDGSEREVAAGDLRTGDRVVVRPGDRVPTDAEVIEGASAVDESMLTGESRPVEKGRGAGLYAGTVNTDGRLVARVTATGGETVLAHIVAVVERAQNSRASIQRLADRVSAIFVPVVVLLALATAAVWGLAPDWARGVHEAVAPGLWRMTLPEGPWALAVIHATAVLIIACPCAMGLATPAAIMAGTNAAALRGILIRDGVALEKAGRIDTVVFDKTGTLTHGQLTVRRVLGGDGGGGGVGEGGAELGWAAELASGSRHPVARAVASFGVANGHGPSGGSASYAWDGWRELRGQGIEGRRDGTVYRLGSLGWLRGCGVAGVPLDTVAGEEDDGFGRVGFAVGDRWVATFELEDALRAEAAGVVEALRRDGFRVCLISGDAATAVRALAERVGIAEGDAMAEVRPEGKAEALATWQRAGRRVAFVGDGINDGPALARADLGIAVGEAADVARESADVVLMRRGLGVLREALGISQATLRTIRQNLFWAFFYNAVGVPLAMLGFFSPILCAAAMGLSDLIVIGNALRLRYWRPNG